MLSIFVYKTSDNEVTKAEPTPGEDEALTPRLPVVRGDEASVPRRKGGE
jgi:hypothetical protein